MSRMEISLMTLVLSVPIGQQQTVEIDWSVVSCGSGNSTGSPDANGDHTVLRWTIGQHIAGIVGSADYTLTSGFWVPPIVAPLPPIPDPTGIDKSRYISFGIPTPSTGAEITALQVKFARLMHPDPPNLPQFPAPDFSAAEGNVRYVSAPSNCQETEVPPTTFKCASLQCAPVYLDWDAVLGGELLHVNGQAVVPSSQYEVRQLGISCQSNELMCIDFSLPLIIATQRWGDLASPFQAKLPAPLTQPNIIDVAATVDKFKAVPTAIMVPRADVNPSIPNQRVDIADIANIVDGFKNLAYPFPGPAECP